jgi:RES domain-containing protein
LLLRALASSNFYRVHSPRWANTPLSGAGAARHGGRFNRPGQAALYLSANTQTALAEYQQDDVLLPPGTLVTYAVKLAAVIDLSGGYEPASWSAEWAQWNCDWRAMTLDKHTAPPSWALAELALTAGASGILFPSLRCAEPDALNLVLYVDSLGVDDQLGIHDPKGVLGAGETHG